ncbi:hypothetical protein H6G64_32375 [Calothrix sp. FACHB-156]|nr:hypothetical protein [Calothrix sp. FACHB-156]
MAKGTPSQEKWYAKIKNFENNVTAPFLQVLVNLWVPAFTAVLSFIFFCVIPQTLEIYRVFALNPSQEVIRIICSFISIFILSLLIWYSGRNLVPKEEKKPDDSNSEKEPDDSNSITNPAFLTSLAITFIRTFVQKIFQALRNVVRNPENIAKTWLPRFLGCVPLVALGFGLLNAMNGIPPEGSVELKNQAWIALFLFIIYWIVVLFRHKLPSQIPSLLFTPRFLLFLNFLSILVVSIFTFPLVPDGSMKAVVIFFMLFLQYLLSWFLSRESTSLPNVNIFRNFFSSLFRLSGVIEKEKKIIYIFLFLSTLILFLVAYLPYFVSNPLASKIGSVNIIALFLMVCVFWGSLLFNYGNTTGIPFIAILLIFAIGFSGLNWNDNHHLRELSSSKQLVENSLKDLKTSFNDWINSPSRKAEIKKFNDTGKPYPIYIVSAQGGGIFAAYHAALTLSRLQDSFPAFTSHVFAISGVSGGSLGTAVFSSLVNAPLSETKDNVQDNGLGSLAQKAHYVLDHDFLSPLLSAGLFPDFAQRFLPVIPIYPFSTISEGVDRARGIEYAFEQAWDHARDKWDKEQKVPYDPQKDNPLRNSYYEHWKPGGTAPALVLNTTVVETGERLVLSPFKIDLPALKDIRTVACQKDIDFPLSTAAILSARFTFVTPVGWFDRCDSEKDGKNLQQKARLADGGYFENSGISTAYEIGKRLEEILEKDIKDKKIKVIYLALTDQPSSEIPKAGGFNEVMSPIGAAWNSWQTARGLSAIAQIEYLVDGANADPNSTFQKQYANHHFRQFYLHDVDLATKKPFSTFDLPLGWFLSKYSQDFIQKQIGYENGKDCPDDLTKGSHNNCVFRSIKEELALATSLSK